jgi:hypothetical protein
MSVPTYQDLMDFIPVFQDEEMDLRVFRIPSRFINNDIDEDTKSGVAEEVNKEIKDYISSPIFYIGDFPVEKSYLKETCLTKEFITGEIKKIRDQWEFDKTVRPYPDRDLYYNILIHDFESLQRLVDFWTSTRESLVKGAMN